MNSNQQTSVSSSPTSIFGNSNNEGHMVIQIKHGNPLQGQLTFDNKKELAMIKKFIDEALIFFCYGSSAVKNLAVLQPESLMTMYLRLTKDELAREKGMVETVLWPKKPLKEEDWCGFTMTTDMLRISIPTIPPERVSVVELDAFGGANFRMKLVHVANNLIWKSISTHFIADVRYAMYLYINPHKAPLEMKNGKANIFIGTTIMIASLPYVISMTFNGDSVEVKPVSLSARLDDTAQFVLIHR